MKVKTYGIYGLTEWHGKVKAGTIEANLAFVGGTCSPSGAQPAYMVTKDPITQFVIENSKEFKNGFIKLVMLHELPGTDKRIATPKYTTATKAKVAQGTAEKPTEDANAGTETPPTEADNEPTEDDVKADEEETTNEAIDEATTSEGTTEVEFTDNQEAKDYLLKNFGVKPGTMRNRDDIKAVGETYGVKITFANENK